MRADGIPLFASTLSLVFLITNSTIPYALADEALSTQGHVLWIGPPQGANPLERQGVERQGQVSSLPQELEVLWKQQLQTNLDWPPVAAEQGILVIATANAQLIEINESGKELHRIQLPAPAAQSPIITSGGERVVITSRGECLSLTPSGKVRFRLLLPAQNRGPYAAPLATSSGGVVLAAGTSLLELDADGTMVANSWMDEPAAGALLADQNSVFITQAKGTVLRWKPSEKPKFLGSFNSSTVSSSALVDTHLLAAVVGHHTLVLFDTRTGMSRTVLSSPNVALEAPATVGPHSEIWIAHTSGLLVASTIDGQELRRVSLENPLHTSGASSPSPPSPNSTAPSPALLASVNGTIAFVRRDGTVGIVQDSPRMAKQRACTAPFALLSNGKQLIVACRDGTLVAYGDSEANRRGVAHSSL